MSPELVSRNWGALIDIVPGIVSLCPRKCAPESSAVRELGGPLIRGGVIDEIGLSVHPLLLGSGTPLIAGAASSS